MARSAEESARRVLIVGPRFSFKPSFGVWPDSRSGLMFYSFAHRLANGFTRNGHFVFSLDDRDCRKQTLGLRRPAAWLADRRLLQVAHELRPDLICLQHCDLISPDTIHQIRELLPQTRVAVVYYDNIFQPASAARFRRFLEAADFAFATTAGRLAGRVRRRLPGRLHPQPRRPVDRQCQRLCGGAQERRCVLRLRRRRRGPPLGPDRRVGAG